MAKILLYTGEEIVDYALETIALTKRFPGQPTRRGLLSRRPDTLPAVHDVNLCIRAGELFGLVGPNGAGKTTLIKLLATLIEPSSGTARINGYELTQHAEIKASIGLVTSNERSFFWRLTGQQNLAFFAALHNLPPSEIAARTEEVLATMDMQEVADKPFQTYSTGMRQRLSLGRALLSQPRLLLLDEPTKGLDPLAAQSFHQLIREQLIPRGITILLTSHQLHEVERVCDRVAIMDQGHILACGTIPGLRQALGLDESTPLETIFGQLLAQGESKEEIICATTSQVGSEATSSRIMTHQTERGDPSPQGTLPTQRRLRANLRSTLHIVWATLKRDFQEEISYRFAFFLQFGGVLFTAAVFYFIAQLFSGAAAPYLQPYGGNYFAFVLIGVAFGGYLTVGLSSFSSSLRQAQTTGTLEAMLTTPAPLATLVLSSAMWSYLMATLRVVVFLGAGVIFMQVDLGKGNFPAALLILGLTILSFSSLGVIAASFIMVLKRGDPITWLFSAASSLLGGVYYPVTVLPGWLQPFTCLLPVTFALRAMRLALLQGAPLADLWRDCLALGLFCLILMPLSLWAFRYAVQRARAEGSLTHY